jgi:hypothetical protein
MMAKIRTLAPANEAMYRRVSPHQGAASLQRFFSTPALVTHYTTVTARWTTA